MGLLVVWAMGEKDCCWLWGEEEGRGSARLCVSVCFGKFGWCSFGVCLDLMVGGLWL